MHPPVRTTHESLAKFVQVSLIIDADYLLSSTTKNQPEFAASLDTKSGVGKFLSSLSSNLARVMLGTHTLDSTLRTKLKSTSGLHFASRNLIYSVPENDAYAKPVIAAAAWEGFMIKINRPKAGSAQFFCNQCGKEGSLQSSTELSTETFVHLCEVVISSFNRKIGNKFQDMIVLIAASENYGSLTGLAKQYAGKVYLLCFAEDVAHLNNLSLYTGFMDLRDLLQPDTAKE